MIAYAELTSNETTPEQRQPGESAPTAVLLTDGYDYRVVGSSNLAKGVTIRGRRWFRPGELFDLGDARHAFAHLTRAASSLVRIHELQTAEGDLRAFAHQLGQERGEPVLSPHPPHPATPQPVTSPALAP